MRALAIEWGTRLRSKPSKMLYRVLGQAEGGKQTADRDVAYASNRSSIIDEIKLEPCHR